MMLARYLDETRLGEMSIGEVFVTIVLEEAISGAAKEGC